MERTEYITLFKYSCMKRIQTAIFKVHNPWILVTGSEKSQVKPKKEKPSTAEPNPFKSSKWIFVDCLVLFPLMELKCLNNYIKINYNFYSALTPVAGTRPCNVCVTLSLASAFQLGNSTAHTWIHSNERWEWRKVTRLSAWRRALQPWEHRRWTAAVPAYSGLLIFAVLGMSGEMLAHAAAPTWMLVPVLLLTRWLLCTRKLQRGPLDSSGGAWV